jgi:hypothetical protein
MEPTFMIIALTALITKRRNLLSSSGMKAAVWNWAAKGRSPMQTAGREDGTTKLIGASTIHSVSAARSQDFLIGFLRCMSKRQVKRGGEMNDKITY